MVTKKDKQVFNGSKGVLRGIILWAFGSPLTVIAISFFIALTAVGGESGEKTDGKKDVTIVIKKGDCYGEPYDILGYKLILDPVQLDDPNKSSLDRVRILFPINIHKDINGFYGYIDCFLDNGVLNGPIYQNEPWDSPFTATDFKETIENNKEDYPLFVINLSKCKGDAPTIDTEDFKVPTGLDTLITLTTIGENTAKSSDLVPEDVRVGWGKNGEFLVQILYKTSIRYKPSRKNSGSFVLCYAGDKEEPINIKSEDNTNGESKSRVSKEEVSLPESKDTFVMGYKFNERKTITERCLIFVKLPADDKHYAPGYIVSLVDLTEAEITTAVNTDFDSTLYFDTNLIDYYFRV